MKAKFALKQKDGQTGLWSVILTISNKPDILTKVHKILVVDNGSTHQFENYKDFENSYKENKVFLVVKGTV